MRRISEFLRSFGRQKSERKVASAALPGFRVLCGEYTSIGNYRDNNEDRLYTDGGRGVYIVADGMGGQAAGEQAS